MDCCLSEAVWTSAPSLFIIINKRIVYKGLLHCGIFPSLNKGVGVGMELPTYFLLKKLGCGQTGCLLVKQGMTKVKTDFFYIQSRNDRSLGDLFVRSLS